MASYVTPKKNAELIFYISLVSRSTGQLQSNPTLAAGDFKVSTDGGALANLTTLPAVTPAASKAVKVTVSASEMNGDNIVIIGSDAAGAEWDDVFVNIQTSARQIDDLAFPTTSGRSIDVTAAGEVGIDWANIGSPTTTVNLSGTTVKQASDNYTREGAPAGASLAADIAAVQADTNDIQTRLPAALSGDGFIKADLLSINDGLVNGNNAVLKLKSLDIQAVDGTFPLNVSNSQAGVPAVNIYSEGVSSPAIEVFGQDVGLRISATDSHAVGLYTGGNGHGIDFQGAGTGKSINATQGILGSDTQDLSVTNITDKVWDEATAGHTTAGTTGKALTDAGSAGDPWGTALPGAYGSGTAGKIIGDNINATISSRSSHSAADVWAVGTRTLTSFGTLVADIWSNATRTLTAISDSAGITTLLSRIGSALNISGGKVEANVKQINDTNVTGDGSTTPWGPA